MIGQPVNIIRMQATITFEYETDIEYFRDILDDPTPDNIAREEQLAMEDCPLDFLQLGVITEVTVAPL